MEELKKIAKYVFDLSLSDVSEYIINTAKYCVLDSVGAAVGAAGAREIKAIAEEYDQWNGLGENRLGAFIWGRQKKSNLQTAVFINGMMAHHMELDDVHTASKSHIGAVVVPTAWSVAEAIGADGVALLEAVIAGYEVMSRIGKGMDVVSTRKRGWHATGIVGTFGAAAAAGKLLKLNAEELVSAFGMAGTQSSGLWAFLADGASCKKLHTGRAAVNGLSSCLLAKSGMTGPLHILDAKDGGLYAAISDSFDMITVTEGLGSVFEITKMDKKPYPCCRTTHPSIDGALFLLEEGVRTDSIKSILIETYDVGVLQCGFPDYPKTQVEAKFSIPYTVAAALVNGKVTQEEFSEATMQNPEVRRIAGITRVVEDPLFSNRYPAKWGSRITIQLISGENFVKQIDAMSGSVDAPLSPKQEFDKYIGLTKEVFGEKEARRFAESILSMEKQQRVPSLSGSLK